MAYDKEYFLDYPMVVWLNYVQHALSIDTFNNNFIVIGNGNIFVLEKWLSHNLHHILDILQAVSLSLRGSVIDIFL